MGRKVRVIMNILLDTQIAIWSMTNDKRLTDAAREIILNPRNMLFYSAASVIEVDWKIRSKKNNIEFTLDQFIQKCQVSRFIPAPLKGEYIAAASHLVWDGEGEEHKDPFDRMLLAQAMVEGMKFMTADGKIPYFKQDCVISV